MTHGHTNIRFITLFIYVVGFIKPQNIACASKVCSHLFKGKCNLCPECKWKVNIKIGLTDVVCAHKGQDK